MSEPRTKAGQALAAWERSDARPIQVFGFYSVHEAIRAIEAEAAAPSEASTSLEDALEEALSSIHLDNVLIATDIAAHPAMRPFQRRAMERDMADAYYRTLERHGCDHDFADVAQNEVSPPTNSGQTPTVDEPGAHVVAHGDEEDLFDPDPAYDLMDES